MIFKSAIQIINVHSCEKDINGCVEMIRVSSITGDLFMEVLQDHPRGRSTIEAATYQMDETLALPPDQVTTTRFSGEVILYSFNQHYIFEQHCTNCNV